MRILVIGATGTIGSAVSELLSREHEVIKASRNGDIQVDISNPASILSMYENVGKVDAIVSTAGSGAFGPLDALNDDDFSFGLGNKLMGQVNLVRFGRDYLNDDGFFTLTSGILAEQPNPASVLITTLNAGIEGFGRAAALGLPRNQSLAVVSPPMVRETAIKLGWGQGGVPAADVAELYALSLSKNSHGTVLGVEHLCSNVT
ncbi:short chain dehydrogenase [Shimia sp. R10_1]|uniref:short chain dehydrogenase n=1 Tax=Shimia sp. R10_1 TaxID=2821095 RepID=UPI001ADC9B82|nr:short chain dehydrogenase [Shimia sp. R10_1]MBO9475461.1 short chain dehydrogenase [Shimia sp. R10_1]